MGKSSFSMAMLNNQMVLSNSWCGSPSLSPVRGKARACEAAASKTTRLPQISQRQ